MRLIPIPPAQIERVWPRVGPWLLSAAARPGCDLSAEQMKTTCLREEGQMIVILDRLGRSVAAGVTQVREGGPDGRSCWVLAVGGTGAQGWRHTLRDIEAGARRMGCALVEFVGRPGWARLLPDYAVTPCEAGTHYAKRLG